MTAHPFGCDDTATRLDEHGRPYCRTCGVRTSTSTEDTTLSDLTGPDSAIHNPTRVIHSQSTDKSQGCASSDAQAMCGTLVLRNRTAPHRCNDRGLDQETEAP